MLSMDFFLHSLCGQPEWDDKQDLDLIDMAKGKNENHIMKKSRIYVPLD